MGQETMVSLLPVEFAPEIQHKKITLSQRTLVEHDAVILVINADDVHPQLERCPQSKLLQQQYSRTQAKGKTQSLRCNDSSSGCLLVVGFAKPTASRFEQLSLAGKLWKELEAHAAERVAIACLGFEPSAAEALLNAVVAAVLAGAAPLPSYKTSVAGKSTLQTITVLHETQSATLAAAIARTTATQAGNHLARWLTTLPPNELNCGSYRKALQQLAKREGWQAEFFDLAKLKQLKAGAFLAVARANSLPEAGIMRLRYSGATTPSKAKRHAGKVALTLVGKGICFDTGGINLKSHKSMYDMHTDMQGSAVAVGTLLALTQLKVPFAIECWLALTENEIGPNAYRPQEVITAANGVTIQVVHSDAEGRMALADTLSLAARERPALMLDFATLTGACVAALTERMSGAFSNRAELRDAIELAGRNSGERVWNFPMDADFDADLDSPIADIMQCTLDNKGDHILAARFLNRFVPDSVPWVHIDLSSSSRSGGLAHIPTDITGFGVRWAVEFVTQHGFN
jgi:leucyl aminopeptidase